VLEVDMEAKHDEQTARLLAGIAKRGIDMRPALRLISDELRMAEDPWFRTKGEGAWLPLADITREYKAAHGFPSDPLVRTGALGYSLTSNSGTGAVRKTGKDEMRFGTRIRYAKFHAIGGSIPYRKPVIPVDQHTRKRMIDTIQEYALTGKTVRRRIH